MASHSLLLYVALCVSSLSSIEAAATAVGAVTTATSISAHVNMVAVGDPTKATTAQATGHVGVMYYDYRTNDWIDNEKVLLNPYTLHVGPPAKVTYGDPHTDINGNNGFGISLACANEDTMFISAANQDYNSGRVYLYKGRNAHWTAQQILNSYHTGPSETYSSSSNSFFGEAIAATESILAVGCRNCNSTVKGYAQSGEIYVFRPEKDKKSVLWTNTQVLTGKDIYFMGGDVAIHQNVIVASGNSKEDFTLNTIATTPILASIFYCEDYLADKGPKSEFKYQQNIATRDPRYQRIADVAVYDMTVAMSTYDTVKDFNNVYIFYPNTKKYKLETKDPKGKPRPLSWSLVQVLSLPDPVASYPYMNPTYLTMWDNRLFMRTNNGGTDVTLDTNRTSRDGAYFPFYLKEVATANPATNHMMVAHDYKLFEDGNTGTSLRLAAAVTDVTPSAMNCLHIWVEDEFDDGWDVAELIIESPNGVKRSYKTDCDSVNPLVQRYCPVFNDEVESKGIHKMYVINHKEAKFNWEILWRVFDEASGKWYVGDIHTELDFEWQFRDNLFLNTREHHMRKNLTCTVCPQNENEWDAYQRALDAKKPKPKALQNLRSRSNSDSRLLHSRSETSSPTLSPAPTLALDYSKDWNVIEMINDSGGGVTESWFSNQGRGTFFYISDTEGKKLIYSGSACTSGATSVGCYVQLDDGDYMMRVTGANDPHTLERRWKFCQGLNYQASQTEFYFTIEDGVCFPLVTRHQTLVCDNILKITNLMVEVALSGDFSSLIYFANGEHHTVHMNQLTPIAASVSSALQLIFGFEEYSSSIVRVEQTSSSMILVLIDVGLKGLDESMYPTLKLLETGAGKSFKDLIASHVLASPVSIDYDSSVISALTGATVNKISMGDETIDFASEDESNFHEVTEFIAERSEIQAPSNEVLVETEEIIAIAGYLITLVTLVMAMGFVYSNVKQKLNPCDPTVVDKAPIKPSVARANLSSLHLAESSSDDDCDGASEDESASSTEDEESNSSSSRAAALRRKAMMSLEKKKQTSNVSMASQKSKNSNNLKFQKLLDDEDAVYRKGSKLAGVR